MYVLLRVPFMGFVLLTHGKLGPLVGAIAGNSRLLAFEVPGSFVA
jgi:hypothetical protein